MHTEFFRNKRVLITGHTGFKGAWLSLILAHFGAEVIGYALPSAHPQGMFALCDVEDRIHSYSGDVLDPQKLQDVMATHAPEIVMHLAAQTLVLTSYADPVTTYATNVLGTLHVLEACRRQSEVRAIINVTSDKCYDNTQSAQAFRENDRLGGQDIYSSSKACSELLSASYRSSFFQPTQQNSPGLSTVRAGNVIGGGDWAEFRIMPDCMRSLLASTPIVIRNPNAIRPWQHVLDCLSGYLLVAKRLYDEPDIYAQAWNVGPPPTNSIRVFDMVQDLIALWGSGEYHILEQGDAPSEAETLRIDSSKMHQILHWQPKWNYRESLERTVQWYKEFSMHQHDHDYMRHWTIQQIDDYFTQKREHV